MKKKALGRLNSLFLIHRNVHDYNFFSLNNFNKHINAYRKLIIKFFFPIENYEVGKDLGHPYLLSFSIPNLPGL